MTDQAKVEALRKEYDQKRRFRNIALVLMNDATMGLAPMGAAYLADDGRSYDDRLKDARGQIDTARSALSEGDANIALGGSIVAPMGLGLLGAGGRVARELSLPGANAMYAAGQLTRPALMGGAGVAGAYDPRLQPDEQKREYVKGFLSAYLPARAGASFPEIRDYGGLAVDAVQSARAARQRRLPPAPEATREPPTLGPTGAGRAAPAAAQPPQRTAPPATDVNELLSEIDDLSKQIGANGEELSQLRYSRNRQRLTANPNSLQSRLQQGPRPYSGKRAPDREQMMQMQMAHGEFRAAIEGPAADFQAGRISEQEFNAAAEAAVVKAARGNNVDPQYLVRQIAKDQKRDPKGWALTFPGKK